MHGLLNVGDLRVSGIDQVMNEDVASGRQTAVQRFHQLNRVLLVEDVVHDAAQQQADRLLEVQVLAHLGVPENGRRLQEITLHDDGRGAAGQQRTGVGENDGVVVDIDHAGGLVEALGYLVDIFGGRQA